MGLFLGFGVDVDNCITFVQIRYIKGAGTKMHKSLVRQNRLINKNLIFKSYLLTFNDVINISSIYILLTIK